MSLIQFRSSRRRRGLSLLLWAVLALAGCARQGSGMPAATPLFATSTPQAAATPPATPFMQESPVPAQIAATAAAAIPPARPAAPAVHVPAPDFGPFLMDESHCGLQLPVAVAPASEIEGGTAAPVALAQIPEEARPAVEYMLSYPGRVGLAAYEVGRESEGVYLNADVPLPLASVVKVVHLVAYANAVQLGQLDPASTVPLADLERYYLPNSDLGSHPRAIAALAADERIFGNPPSVLLEDVPRMMMEFSSNAATDYLHMLLGQERIEATAVVLGMTRQTAPCPFLGQFLLMGQRDDGLGPVWQLIEDPRLYSREVMALTEQYSSDQAFRDELRAWQEREYRPSIEAQQLFSERLNAHGSAREYANVMAQIALNNMGPWEESVRVRRYMEWPTHFPDNQEQLAWLGYKGGSLPGVLTVVYYAQPWDAVQPVVVALFFHDLPTEVYRQWRRNLPHDELARWLLRERQAIPLLNSLLP